MALNYKLEKTVWQKNSLTFIYETGWSYNQHNFWVNDNIFIIINNELYFATTRAFNNHVLWQGWFLLIHPNFLNGYCVVSSFDTVF